MEVVIYYSVYIIADLLGSKNNLVLQPVEFGNGWKPNRFDTEEEAIEALIKDNKTYEDFVIIKHVFIQS